MKLQKEALGNSFYLGGGKTGFLRRLSWSKPSPTLVTDPMMPATDLGHPVEDRPLSIQEYKRIQEFPDSWKLSGNLRNQYKQNDSGYSLGDGPDFGKGLEKYCNMDPAVVTTLEQTCGQLHSVGMGCPDNMAWQLDDTRAATAVTYRAKCCEACKPGEKLDRTHNCVPCPVGYQQDRGNVEKCEKCVDDTYSSAQTNGECIPCPEGEQG